MTDSCTFLEMSVFNYECFSYAKDLVVGRDSVISLISDAGELGKRDEVVGVHVLVQKGVSSVHLFTD